VTDKTDWDRYYLKDIPLITKIARAMNGKAILRAYKAIDLIRSEISICELGGANSCFAQQMCEKIPVNRYHIVDSNEIGLSLVNCSYPGTQVTVELSDVLLPYSNNEHFDLVYSVGLIEHFQSTDIKTAVHAHFARCKRNGYVLITFPTPTWLYKLCRTCLTMAGKWDFHDEIPIEMNKARNLIQQFGVIRYESITWSIGLTQGLLLVEKQD
jgi:hypothetical protein